MQSIWCTSPHSYDLGPLLSINGPLHTQFQPIPSGVPLHLLNTQFQCIGPSYSNPQTPDYHTQTKTQNLFPEPSIYQSELTFALPSYTTTTTQTPPKVQFSEFPCQQSPPTYPKPLSSSSSQMLPFQQSPPTDPKPLSSSSQMLPFKHSPPTYPKPLSSSSSQMLPFQQSPPTDPKPLSSSSSQMLPFQHSPPTDPKPLSSSSSHMLPFQHSSPTDPKPLSSSSQMLPFQHSSPTDPKPLSSSSHMLPFQHSSPTDPNPLSSSSHILPLQHSPPTDPKPPSSKPLSSSSSQIRYIKPEALGFKSHDAVIQPLPLKVMKGKWYWKHNGSWNEYDSLINMRLEYAYQVGRKKEIVIFRTAKGSKEYEIDFETEKQLLLAKKGCCRQILRDPAIDKQRWQGLPTTTYVSTTNGTIEIPENSYWS